MAYTKAQMRATNKYIKEKYDEISVIVPKGEKSKWKEAAKKQGLSLNAFIKQCVYEKYPEI